MNGLAAPIGSLLGRIISPTASSLARCRVAARVAAQRWEAPASCRLPYWLRSGV